jgi:AcrR family transcriptional regulator
MAHLSNNEQTGANCSGKVAMTAKKPDRRVQRTRQILRDALISLILEKGYEAITVQDILERANVGRSTFYVHYWGGKEELLLGIFEQIQESLEANMAEILQKNRPDLSLMLFQHAASHHQLYKAMTSKQSGNMVLNYVQKYLATLIREHLKIQVAQEKTPTFPLEVMVQYIVGSFLALMAWWLEHDLPYSATEMATMFNQLTQSGLAAILNEKRA